MEQGQTPGLLLGGWSTSGNGLWDSAGCWLLAQHWLVLMCACVDVLQPQDQGLLACSEVSRLLYLPLVTICILSLCLYYYWRGASVFLIAKKRLGQVPDKPEKQDRNNVLRETYCSYRVSGSVEELLGVGSRSPPSYFPLYPHASMEYERFFWPVNKTRTETFFFVLSSFTKWTLDHLKIH